jgi:hypothetical protein
MLPNVPINANSDADVALAAESLKLPEQQVREALRVSSKLHLLTHENLGLSWLFRSPSRPSWKRFRQASEKGDTDGIETLVLDCAILPDRKMFNALLDEYPALAEAIGNTLAVLAGASVEKKA